LLAVLCFRSFYGSSEPGTPFHNNSIPSNPVRPPFQFNYTPELTVRITPEEAHVQSNKVRTL